jgi:hypothetical protein
MEIESIYYMYSDLIHYIVIHVFCNYRPIIYTLYKTLMQELR